MVISIISIFFSYRIGTSTTPSGGLMSKPSNPASTPGLIAWFGPIRRHILMKPPLRGWQLRGFVPQCYSVVGRRIPSSSFLKSLVFRSLLFSIAFRYFHLAEKPLEEVECQSPWFDNGFCNVYIICLISNVNNSFLWHNLH